MTSQDSAMGSRNCWSISVSLFFCVFLSRCIHVKVVKMSSIYQVTTQFWTHNYDAVMWSYINHHNDMHNHISKLRHEIDRWLSRSVCFSLLLSVFSFLSPSLSLSLSPSVSHITNTSCMTNLTVSISIRMTSIMTCQNSVMDWTKRVIIEMIYWVVSKMLN